MVRFFALVLALTAATAHAAPLHKRIAQVISDSTKKWEAACNKAGGGTQCNPVAVAAFGNLLAAAPACGQQDAADKMIDLAKTLNNDPDMIKFAQIFAEQPRNTPSSQSVQYCDKAPRNAELNGLFQCQFAGANPTTFVGNVPVGQPGTIPFGRNQPVSPPGSCPAHPQGPIPDGSQLVDITQNPGVPSASPGSPPSTNTTTAAAPTATKAAGRPPKGSKASTSAPPPKATAGGDFHLQNGQDAQKLNAKFKTLTPTSPCTAGEDACINGGFAQCTGSSFAVTPCAGGTQCFALPLVNKPGTSITCTTPQDAASRIAATGATGGVDGSG